MTPIEKLRICIKDSGYELSVIAEACGIETNLLFNWLAGTIPFREAYAGMISRAIGNCSYHYILWDEEDFIHE